MLTGSGERRLGRALVTAHAGTAESHMVDLPLIDVAPLLEPNGFSGRSGLAQIDALHAACTGSGFFYLTQHGVAAEQERALFALARRFFELPLEAKLRIENVHSAQFRGYTRVGREQTGGVPDLREQLDLGRELPVARLPVDSPLYLRLRGPNQWPAELPALRSAILPWAHALDRAATAVTRALAVALGQAPDHFDAAFLPDPDTHVKVIRYPGVDRADGQGVGPHKDYGFLAFVLQDERGGLEVDDGQGSFVEAPPIQGTLVANIGEMFEVATNGYFRATRHRVRSPQAPADRISLAHFFCPKLEAVLGEVNLPPHLQANRAERVVDPHNPIYSEFGENALRGWVRSHPAVAQRHYPELEVDPSAVGSRYQ
jgi:isopenicillin N synthase-like dioxygenase